MTSMIPLRPLKYQFPLLHIGDTTASHSVYPASNEVFNLQDPIDVKKAIYRLLDGQWGDIDGVCERWTNGYLEEVEKEFAVREEKLRGLKAMVLVLRQVLDLGERCLSADPMECYVLNGNIEKAIVLWNQADMQFLNLYCETFTPFDDDTDAERTTSTEILRFQELTSTDGTADPQSLLKLDTGIPAKRPKPPLSGIPSLSTANHVQAQIESWESEKLNALRDVEYLVDLCDRYAPEGKKGWDTLNRGDKPSLAQVYAQSYAQRKDQAINEISEALELAWAGKRFPPVPAIIVKFRDGIERWNALSKEIQLKIDQEIEKRDRLMTFLPLSPDQATPIFPATAPPTPSNWLSNNSQNCFSSDPGGSLEDSTAGRNSLRRPPGFSSLEPRLS
ncbi:hypothetical protein K440DRAFT_637792 [Wilcoxina mikolae CBS 423.85]|nr:hypothetical protein K440DRAFT_637792 [Wilcoxina mikolae CBS 423.85]